MKNLLFFLMLSVLSFAIPNEANAQTEKRIFMHTNVEKNITYQVMLKVSGYQVEIWYTSTTSSGTAAWTQAKVLYSDDDVIKYQVAYNNWRYELTMDPYNEDAIYIQNMSTNGKKYRYFAKD